VDRLVRAGAHGGGVFDTYDHHLGQNDPVSAQPNSQVQFVADGDGLGGAGLHEELGAAGAEIAADAFAGLARASGRALACDRVLDRTLGVQTQMCPALDQLHIVGPRNREET
jgi:hypothetical protein